jgi:hypothetical protein
MQCANPYSVHKIPAKSAAQGVHGSELGAPKIQNTKIVMDSFI